MRRRIFLAVGLLLVVGLVIAFLVPATRYQILALIRNERLYDGRPIGHWVGALKDEDPEVRRVAARSLGDAQVCKEGVPDDPQCQAVLAALVEALGDRVGQVRKVAASSLLMYPREAPVPDNRAAVARLTGALGDEELMVRKAAARSLWRAGPAAKEGDGVARLTRALGDVNDFVREYAARALGRIGPDAGPAVPALIERLRKDEERDVREHAAKSLGLIGAKAIGPLLPEAVAALTKGLKDEARDVRENSARALGQLDARGAVPTLRWVASKDGDERVRATAAEALKRLGSAASDKGS